MINYEIESAKILKNIPSVFHDALQTLAYRASNGGGEENVLNHLQELVNHLEEPIFKYLSEVEEWIYDRAFRS